MPSINGFDDRGPERDEIGTMLDGNSPFLEVIGPFSSNQGPFRLQAVPISFSFVQLRDNALHSL
jgi:hypothetical protein